MTRCDFKTNGECGSECSTGCLASPTDTNRAIQNTFPARHMLLLCVIAFGIVFGSLAQINHMLAQQAGDQQETLAWTR